MKTNDGNQDAVTSVFHTTRWSVVVKARGDAPEARAALGELCASYWTPVFRFLRREGRSEDASQDLAQAFFERILSGSSIEQADPTKGRFRSYLLGALKHFLAEQKRNVGRLKRGGDVKVESLDSGATETSPGLQIPDPTTSAADTSFDREWALTVMDRGLTSVRNTLVEAGKQKQFDLLKPWLMGDTSDLSQSDAAEELGMTPGAVKVAIHRLRKTFGETIRSEIEQTVSDPKEVSAELRYLIEVLS